MKFLLLTGIFVIYGMLQVKTDLPGKNKGLLYLVQRSLNLAGVRSLHLIFWCGKVNIIFIFRHLTSQVD